MRRLKRALRRTNFCVAFGESKYLGTPGAIINNYCTTMPDFVPKRSNQPTSANTRGQQRRTEKVREERRKGKKPNKLTS